MTTLVCDGISVAIGSIQIVKDVSFALQTGTIVGLIGPNGSGKTTLLNVISGDVPPTKGNVRLDTMFLTGRPRHHLTKMGLFRSFQDGRLFKSLTAEENLAVAFQPAPEEGLLKAFFPHRSGTVIGDERLAVVAQALRAVDIVPERNRTASQLSYGTRKRAIIAQAIVADPVICLLDEPLAGVDPATREKMIATIGSLRHPKRILLIVEHDLEAVRALADEVLLMDRGQIVAAGLPAEVLSSEVAGQAYLQSHGH